jgi:4'-phosphopantetheinyl transferase
MSVLVELAWATEIRERPADLALLTSTEQVRREELRLPADRARFTLGTTLLRRITGRVLGIPAASVAIDRTCHWCGQPHGRPKLPGTNLYASISHSGDRVVAALAFGAPVGVDVQRVEQLVAAEVADQVLGAGEVAADALALFVYWARKEAVVKATGDGLTIPLTQVLVGDVGSPPVLSAYPTRPVRAVLRDLDAGTGYAAALAVLTDEAVQVRSTVFKSS